MRKSDILIKIYICLLGFSLFSLMACSGQSDNLEDNHLLEMQTPEETLQEELLSDL